VPAGILATCPRAGDSQSQFLPGEKSREGAAHEAAFRRASYQRAGKVVDSAIPEVVEAMDAGKLPIKVASEVADLPAEQQREGIKKEDVGTIW
jgi:hypothetical protein